MIRYMAKISDARGRVLASAVKDTREETAQAVFALRPSAKECTTSIAVEFSPGLWRDANRDLRWIKRERPFPTMETLA